MPAYKTLTQPPALYYGDSYPVFNAERPLTGATSERVAVVPAITGAETDLSVQLDFAGAPGAFQVDIQTSDEDLDTSFVTQNGTSITTVNTNNSASFMFHFKALFVRLIMTTQSANAVNLTAKITR